MARNNIVMGKYTIVPLVFILIGSISFTLFASIALLLYYYFMAVIVGLVGSVIFMFLRQFYRIIRYRSRVKNCVALQKFVDFVDPIDRDDYIHKIFYARFSTKIDKENRLTMIDLHGWDTIEIGGDYENELFLPYEKMVPGVFEHMNDLEYLMIEDITEPLEKFGAEFLEGLVNVKKLICKSDQFYGVSVNLPWNTNDYLPNLEEIYLSNTDFIERDSIRNRRTKLDDIDQDQIKVLKQVIPKILLDHPKLQLIYSKGIVIKRDQFETVKKLINFGYQEYIQNYSDVLRKVCASCQHVAKSNHKFCTQCGSKNLAKY